MSLDQILTAQLDEPNQKCRVYKVEYGRCENSGAEIVATQKFVQIRVKSIEFIDTKAISIYFYDVTHNIESFKEINKTDNSNGASNAKRNRSSLHDGFRMQKIMAHEFRAGLSTTLMFLQNLLLLNNLPEQGKTLVLLIISQINFLISHISDTDDLRMIEEGKFSVVNESFRLADTLDFIRALFIPKMALVNNTLTIAIEEGASYDLPEKLIGDHIRLKQILINLTKKALSSLRAGEVKIFMSYDQLD